jgi:putative peptidoglycan lipid II flippase
MGAATLISRVMGLVREQVFAYLFGAGNFTDAFNVAFRIPNLLRNLFAEGAMSAALVPVFAGVREQEGDARAWRVAGLIFRVLLVSVFVFSVLGIFFAPILVGLYASAFHDIPGKFELTVRMTRIMFPFFPLVALSAAFMAVLNASGFFFLPALSSALFNLSSVAVGAFFAVVVFKNPAYGFAPIEGMAMGIVVGGLIQALFQIPMLYRAGYHWKKKGEKQTTEPTWFRDPALRRMLKLMIPGVAGLAATQVSILFNTFLATSQGPGAVSWLGYAFRLMQFPIGIFGVSLASAALPELSRHWAKNELPQTRDTLLETLEHVWTVNLPASVGLAVLGVPIVALLFQYGHFSAQDTEATALALTMYSVGLAAYSGVKVLAPACYAMGNSRAPVISSALSVALGLMLNLVLLRFMGYWGLALATSLSSIFNLLFLVYSVRLILRSRGVEMSHWSYLAPFFKHLINAVAMGLVCWFSYRKLNGFLPESAPEIAGFRSILWIRTLKVGAISIEGVAIVFGLDRIQKKVKQKLK